MQPEFRVDADQVRIKRRVVNRRQRNTVRHNRMSDLLVSATMCAASSNRDSGNPERAQRPLYADMTASRNEASCRRCFTVRNA